jgi:RNA polymerase subunit RPABC4/transcription elongation factor Spt4
MIRTDKCPNCCSLDIGKGYWSGYAALMPLGKPLSMGSKVIVRVCRGCGHIFDLQAEKPEKF